MERLLQSALDFQSVFPGKTIPKQDKNEFNASFIELPGSAIWTPDLQLFNYVSEIKFELCEVIFNINPSGEINAKPGLYILATIFVDYRL